MKTNQLVHCSKIDLNVNQKLIGSHRILCGGFFFVRLKKISNSGDC